MRALSAVLPPLSMAPFIFSELYNQNFNCRIEVKYQRAVFAVENQNPLLFLRKQQDCTAFFYWFYKIIIRGKKEEENVQRNQNSLALLYIKPLEILVRNWGEREARIILKCATERWSRLVNSLMGEQGPKFSSSLQNLQMRDRIYSSNILHVWAHLSSITSIELSSSEI